MNQYTLQRQAIQRTIKLFYESLTQFTYNASE